MVPKISVVIPAYNEAKFIGACLDHVTHQTDKPDNIFVINNNSTDNTAEIAAKYAEVTVLDQPIQGITPTRNFGFEQVKEGIIARVDADSLAPPNWIAKIRENFTKHPEMSALTGDFYYYDAPLSFLPLRTTIPAKLYMWYLRYKLGHHVLNGPSLVLTKDIWEKVKSDICQDDKSVHEDIDISIHIAKAGGKIIYDPTFMMAVSSRRIVNNHDSFFKEYPARLKHMFKTHGIT